MRIGIVGLGAMGFGMASNILEKHGQLNILGNRNRAPVEKLVAAGAVECADAAQLARDSDCILLCVPNSEIIENIVQEMGEHLTAGKTLIDTGTSSITATLDLNRRLSQRGVRFAEAPLTGGIKQAAAGELGALVGADSETFEKIEPVLRLFCVSVQHFGDVGSGAQAKFVNNYMVMGIVALVTEAFHVASECDLDWDKLYDVVIRGSGDSGAFRRIIGNGRTGDFKGYVYSVEGGQKDMTYITGFLETLGRNTPLSKSVLALYADAVAAGHGDRLLSEMLRPDIRKDLFATNATRS